MFEQRLKTSRIGWTSCGLALLLLTRCGGSTNEAAGAEAGSSSAAPTAGAAGLAHGGSGGHGSLAGETGAGTGGAKSGLGGNSPAGAAGSASEFAGGAGGVPTLADGGAAGSGQCDAAWQNFTDPSATHVSACSAISYPMNPPVYGDHYPVWAAYKSYPFPVPLGFLVHNLEHGAIVLLYNCPEGCSDEVAAAQTFIDALPADPRCTEEVKHQVVLAPDASLPTRWAAVAWGHSLTAACFDPHAVRAFYDGNLAHGPEDICANGVDLAADTCQ